MKAILSPAVLGLMCGLAAAYQNPISIGVDVSDFATVEAVPTLRLHGQVLRKRRLEREDPANPVAAAATDPNVAAMKIRSRDLIPTDRPDPYRHRHPAGHAHQEDDADDSPGGDPDGGDTKPSNRRGGKGATDKRKHSPAKDDDDADNRVEDDDEGNDGKRDKPKPKPASGSSKPKDKSGNKDGDRRSKDAKNDKNSKDSKKKKTHTGLDGNEVSDDNDNDEDSEESEILKKKMLVKHIQAKRRLWRTGQPKYDYKKAMAGWKEVGPLYYYRGKYANAAATTPHDSAVSVALPILVSVMAYAAWI
ncbi:hypothetical protein GGH94_003044 [Coemansia aciculifera]|uniref:Uncharacterized protein n=1 Tax=Coemansia aciculifera TaxID=417176 RepID=A0A9W8IPJ8_9FUNG|nr:hypothetical protein GGH94_003044 [Coemansia aciculifera]